LVDVGPKNLTCFSRPSLLCLSSTKTSSNYVVYIGTSLQSTKTFV